METRTDYQRDVDRIFYSRAWERLGGVTQVVSPSPTSLLLHNRMTHSQKVGQVARTVGFKFQREVFEKLTRSTGIRVDPTVTFAAGLAHDLGHPPYGHAGERALDEWARAKGLEGFEGNAQSFRILVRLEQRYPGHPGMNLTRAVTHAALKYPWPRAPLRLADDGTVADEDRRQWQKFGWYQADQAQAMWVLHPGEESGPYQLRVPRWQPTVPDPSLTRVLEAQVMDVADDITYAMHDLVDFVQVGTVDVGLLQRLANEALSGAGAELREYEDAPKSTREQRRRAARIPGVFAGIALRLGNKYGRTEDDAVPGESNHFDWDTWLKAVRVIAHGSGGQRNPEDVLTGAPSWVANSSDDERWNPYPRQWRESTMRQWTSTHLGYFAGMLSLDITPTPRITMEPLAWHFMQTLKEIHRAVVLQRSDLSAVQYTQRKMLHQLCDALLRLYLDQPERAPERLQWLVEMAYDADVPDAKIADMERGRLQHKNSAGDVVDMGWRELPESVTRDWADESDLRVCRGVVDFVSELTDNQAGALNALLAGGVPPSMDDAVLKILTS